MAPRGKVEIRERIMGTETEFAVFAPDQEQPGVNAQTDFLFPSNYFEGVDPKEFYLSLQGHKGLDGFFSDGSRRYQDVGFFEYSTPELVQPTKLAALQVTSEEKVWDMVKQANDFLEQNGASRKFSAVLKRTLSPENLSCGMHENYLTSNETNFRTLAQLLASHMLSRNIWAGAGGVLINESQTKEKFVAGAKLNDINLYVSSGTLNASKPLINTRDEPLADKDKYSRMHITSGDGHRWPWPVFMQLATTSLVLRLGENGRDLKGLLFDQHEAPFKQVATAAAMEDIKDPTQVSSKMKKATIPVIGDPRYPSLLEMQFRLLDACEQMAAGCFVPDDERQGLAEWRRTLEDLETDPLQLQDRVEYIGKLVLADALGSRGSYNGRKFPLLDFDWRWTNIDPSIDIGNKGVALKPQKAVLELAKKTPLIHTRAHVRGAIVNYLRGVIDRQEIELDETDYVVDWKYLRLGAYIQHLNDPYDNDVATGVDTAKEIVRYLQRDWG